MDYIVNDAELTATADSIREKTGDTALLEWVTGKGFADVIAGIESGGAKFTTGSFTVTTNSTAKTVTHNLGAIPNFCFLFYEDANATGIITAKANCVCFGAYMNGRATGGWFDPNASTLYLGSSMHDITNLVSNNWLMFNSANATTILMGVTSNPWLPAGASYRWIVGVI